MSTPAVTSEAICCSVELISAVFVVVIDCTEIGASPPTATVPTMSWRVERRWIITTSLSAPEDLQGDRAVLRLVHLEEEQPLPCAEGRLAVGDRDRVRGGRQEHRLHVRVTVPALVGMEVLRPEIEIVVPVIRALVRDQLGQVTTEIVERAVLPFVDEQGAGGVRAERDDETLRDARILDRSAEVVGEVEERVPLGRPDREARRDGLQRSLPSAAGRSNVKMLPCPGRLSALICPP